MKASIASQFFIFHSLAGFYVFATYIAEEVRFKKTTDVIGNNQFTNGHYFVVN